jgi:hypothetical protein
MIRMNVLTPVPSTEASASPGAHASQTMTHAVERLAAAKHRTTAELLSELRREFPDSPLSVRVRALEALRNR